VKKFVVALYCEDPMLQGGYRAVRGMRGDVGLRKLPQGFGRKAIVGLTTTSGD
jgi:hypothetical protein